MKKLNKMVCFVSSLILLVLLMPLTSLAAYSKDTPSEIPYNQIEAKVTDYINQRKDGLASVAVGVIDGQNTLFQSYYGYSDIGNQVLADNETVYEWGSVSKLLIWVSVMQLYERGQIDFSRDINDYLPKNFITKAKDGTEITMLNLMNHNAGWQETTFDIEVTDKNRIVDLEEALRQSEPCQVYKPGEVTAYSNWGSALAAYIVERISGMSFDDYVRENIFLPLGMEHTSLSVDGGDNKWVQEQRKKLQCYNITLDSYEELGDSISYILLYPAGSVIGTLSDFVTFAKAFTSDSKICPFFDKEDTLDIMLEATSYYGDADSKEKIQRNCHGLWTTEYGVTVKGHAGNTRGNSATLFFDQESGLAVVVMTNEVGETAFCYGIPNLIFGNYKSEYGAITKKHDLSGIYMARRSYEKGISKIFSIAGGLFPLSKTDKDTVFALSMDASTTLTQMSDNVYLFDDGNGIKMIQYLNENENGKTVLQQYTSDYVKANTITFTLKVLLLIFLVIAIIYAVISLILCGIKKCIFRFSKKKANNKGPLLLRVSETMSKVSIILGAVICYFLILAPLEGSSLTLNNVMWKCIFIGVLSLIPILYFLILILKFNSLKGRRKEKVYYIISAIMGMVFTVNVWYWQLYNYIC